MDPLWLAVVLVGVNVLGIAVVAVIAAVVMTRLSRQAGPHLQEVRNQLAAAQEELHRLSVSVQASQEQLDRLTSGVKKVAGTASRLVGHAPVVPRKKVAPQDPKGRKDVSR
jgi:predicted PurR-regulated permease PerM